MASIFGTFRLAAYDMKRLVVTTGLAVVLMGCGSINQGLASFGVPASGAPVQLLTDNKPYEEVPCDGGWDVGQLIPDPTYGTSLDDSLTWPGGPRPVVWRLGFTGRQVGSDVEVFDADGVLVAKTGQWYRVDGGSWGNNPTLVLACRVTPHDAAGPAGPG
jgi:hypothetical protein